MLLRAHQHYVFIVFVKLHMAAVRHLTGIEVLSQHLLNRVVFVREASAIVCCDCAKVCDCGGCICATITDMRLGK